jgi:cytochrome c-type biogenesis protein CcmH/NrfF
VSALWIIPSLTLVFGALLVWWVGRRAAVEVTGLRAELAEWDRARSDMGALRAEALEVRAGYRHLRRR